MKETNAAAPPGTNKDSFRSAACSLRTGSSSHFFAGMLGGLTSATLLQPLDYLKTQTQLDPLVRKRPSQVVRKIFRNNSWLNLWNGLTPSIVRTSLGTGSYFYILQTIRSSWSQLAGHNDLASVVKLVKVEQERDFDEGIDVNDIYAPHVKPREIGPVGNIVTGASARAIVGLIFMPLTVLKVRYESNIYSYKSLTDAFKSIYKTEGARGFFAGYDAATLRDAPFAGLYLLFYEKIRTSLNKKDNYFLDKTSQIREPSINLISGFLAGAIATAITNPLDVLKTRMQTEPQRYANMFKASVKILRKELAVTMFNGLTLRIMRKALSSAIAWTIYESFIS